MSRVAKYPIKVPANVKVEINGAQVLVTGPRGSLSSEVPSQVEVKYDNSLLHIVPLSQDRRVRCIAGTLRANLNNQVKGVSEGFVYALTLVRVGANAQVEGSKLIVKIGYSNPKEYVIPEGIVIKTPSATEIVVEGIDIQRVSQVAAEIIRIRPPEPYKGTGILKKGQKIALKAAKKK